ncbi:MAG: hypothetical protein ACRDL5_05210 [Solirubrobacteraceae bacterium]
MVAVIVGALGVAWTALTLRSGIEITDDGFRVRGMLRTTNLSWGDTDAFIVVGFSGSNRGLLRHGVDYLTPNSGGPQVVGLSIDAIAREAVATGVPLFSVVAAVTSHGERLRVHGTASTPLDPDFPADAAAELNRTLKQRNPAATASQL